MMIYRLLAGLLLLVSLFQLGAVVERWLALFSRYRKFQSLPGELVGPLLALPRSTTMAWLLIIIVLGLISLWGLKEAARRNDLLGAKLFAAVIWITAGAAAGLLLLLLMPQTTSVR